MCVRDYYTELGAPAYGDMVRLILLVARTQHDLLPEVRKQGRQDEGTRGVEAGQAGWVKGIRGGEVVEIKGDELRRTEHLGGVGCWEGSIQLPMSIKG